MLLMMYLTLEETQKALKVPYLSSHTQRHTRQFSAAQPWRLPLQKAYSTLLL